MKRDTAVGACRATNHKAVVCFFVSFLFLQLFPVVASMASVVMFVAGFVLNFVAVFVDCQLLVSVSFGDFCCFCGGGSLLFFDVQGKGDERRCTC